MSCVTKECYEPTFISHSHLTTMESSRLARQSRVDYHKQSTISQMRRVAARKQREQREKKQLPPTPLVIRSTPRRKKRDFPPTRIAKPAWAQPSNNLIQRSQKLRPAKRTTPSTPAPVRVKDKLQAVYEEIYPPVAREPEYREVVVLERVPSPPPLRRLTIQEEMRKLSRTLRGA